MPIKLPKGFSRRKSAGNEIEEAQNPPTPSFRVLERPHQSSNSFDGGTKLAALGGLQSSSSPNVRLVKTSFEDARITSNRGSGGSNTNSTSTGASYENTSSSRVSTSSTVPSSTDVPVPDDAHPRKPPRVLSSARLSSEPEKQHTFSIRAAGRTFSFGSRAGKQPGSTVGQAADQPRISGSFGWGGRLGRERAMTESSYASTATPPKLSTDFVPVESASFAGIFDGIGDRRSLVMGQPGSSYDLERPGDASPDGQTPLMRANFYEAQSTPRNTIPASPQLHMGASEPSPYSLDSRGSREGLMTSPSSPALSPPGDKDLPPAPPPHGSVGAETSPGQRSRFEGESPTTPRQARHAATGSAGLKRHSAVMVRRSTLPLDDEAARVVLDSSRQFDQGSQVGSPGNVAHSARDTDVCEDDDRKPVSATHSAAQALASAALGLELEQTVRKPGKERDGAPASPVDGGGSRDSRLASREVELRRSDPRSNELAPGPSKHAPLAGILKNQDQAARQGRVSPSTGKAEGGKATRGMRLSSERLSQEPDSAFYPQQSSGLPGPNPARPGLPASASTSFLNLPTNASRASRLSVQLGASQANEEDDDDEDVPLGILAAHGFPNKNNPPSRLSVVEPNPSPRPVRQSNPYPPPPSSLAGESGHRSTRHSNLPVFARGLPQDPYYGSSLANAASRDSFASGLNNPGSHSQMGIPPGGLVGVIASEERAKAMRRNTPTAQGGLIHQRGVNEGLGPFGHGASMSPFAPGPFPGVAPSPNVGPMPGMSPFGGMPIMSPAEQAQVQVSQQMQDMMQMQMQWMQQMMQLHGMQNPPQPWQQQPSFSVTPPLIPGQRPLSTDALSRPGNSKSAHMHQRTMSLLDPTMSANQAYMNPRQPQYAPSARSNSLPPTGYTPSIAPSERTNVGLPSRYRPVSTGPPGPPGTDDKSTARASTFTSGVLQGWSDKDGGSSSKPAVGQNKGSNDRRGEDDDEDEGWEEMKRKREKKKSTWKLKKPSSAGDRSPTRN